MDREIWTFGNTSIGAQDIQLSTSNWSTRCINFRLFNIEPNTPNESLDSRTPSLLAYIANDIRLSRREPKQVKNASRRRPQPVEKSFAKWRKKPSYAAAYDALSDEFAVAEALIDARTKANLRQEDVARRMQTSQTAIARLESGRGNPSLKTLRKYAKATGTKLKLSFQQ